MEFDDDRFFSGASRGDFLDALTAHAGLGSVVAVEGDAGSGVSTLLGQAVMALLADMEVIRIDGNDEHGANVVVEALLRHFNIDRAELPEKLRSTLTDGRMLVVVDNSEELLDEAVTTMAALKQKLGSRLGYVFGGLPGTVEKLKGADFTVDDVLDLPTLTDEDVQDFAWFVLGLELDDSEAERFQHDSEGNVAALLALLRETGGETGAGASVDDDDKEEAGATPSFMARDPEPEREEEDGDSDESDESGEEAQQEPRQQAAPPWRHLAAVIGLLVLVALLWSVFSGDDEGAAPEPESRQLSLPVPDREPSGEPAQEARPQIQPMQPTMEPVARLEDLEKQGKPDVALRETENGVKLEPVTDPVMKSSPAVPDREIAVASAAEEEPETPSPSGPADEGADEAAGSEPREVSVPASEPQLSGLDADLGYKQEDWLATLDDSRWFLQITVTSQEKNARGVLDQLDRNGAYYAARRNGKAVFLVLSGDYPSRQAALDAKSALPAKLRAAGPFPRKMGDIRNEL